MCTARLSGLKVRLQNLQAGMTWYLKIFLACSLNLNFLLFTLPNLSPTILLLEPCLGRLVILELIQVYITLWFFVGVWSI